MELKVTAITATCGRHGLLERAVRMFLNQSYKNSVMLVYNNSDENLRLDRTVPEERVILVNNNTDLETGGSYKDLGSIYRDSLRFLPETDLVSFWDDDDRFLENHIECGVRGFIKGKKLAYKPQSSWYSDVSKTVLISNNMEPSIFIEAEFLKNTGFNLTTGDQHLKWLAELIRRDEIFSDPDGEPTFIYEWFGNVYKTSGDIHNPENFRNCRRHSSDNGDRLISV